MNESVTHDTVEHAMQPEDTPALRELYKGFEKHHLIPLWTQLGDLMPIHPKPRAVPHLWKWSDLLPLAEKSGELVPVGRGGEPAPGGRSTRRAAPRGGLRGLAAARRPAPRGPSGGGTTRCGGARRRPGGATSRRGRRKPG